MLGLDRPAGPCPPFSCITPSRPYEDDPYDITVRPERFDQQMRWLRRAGRRGTSVRQLLDAHRRGAAHGLVGLSFDDGYADFTEYALPVLQRFGFGATMFMPAGLLGADNAWDPEGPRKPLLSAGQLRQVAAAGIEVGSHGFRHLSLPASSDADLAREIGESRDILREVTGQPWMASATRSVISTNASLTASGGPATPTAAQSGIPSSPGGTHSRANTSGTRIHRGPCGPGEPGAG